MSNPFSDLSTAISLLPAWYRANARALPWRADTEPYHVWLSEIMLQQTRVEAVIGYYNRFLAALPTVRELAAVNEEALLKLWEGLGYYSRARNLKKAAEVIVNELGGAFPATYEEILSLPGVGPYTAGAIASICFEQPAPAVDGNVLRVFARLTRFGESIDTDAAKKQVREALLPFYTPGQCGALTQGLMELGATVCIPNGAPKCGLCPVSAYCAAYQQGDQDRFPVRGEKKRRKTVHKTVLLLRCGDRYAIKKRPARGLLAGLWEFPNADLPAGEVPTPETAAALASDWGARPLRLIARSAYTHIFTHVEWHMQAFFMECGDQPGCFTWATAEELARDYALPSAFRPFAALLQYGDEGPEGSPSGCSGNASDS